MNDRFFENEITSGRIFVEYCPCGHTGFVTKDKVSSLVMEEIESGKRLSAPLQHSSTCPECAEDLEDRNRKALFWDLD